MRILQMRLGLPVVSQTLLPRLRTSSRGELGVTTISKTFRNYALQSKLTSSV